MRLLTLLPLAALISPAISGLGRATSYGYWYLELYSTTVPSGVYSKSYRRAEYFLPSSEVGSIVYCGEEYKPGGGRTNIPCNDTTFSFEVLPESQFQLCNTYGYTYEIKQTVLLDGQMVPLVGRKNITMRRSGIGLTQDALELIEARPAKDAVWPW